MQPAFRHPKLHKRSEPCPTSFFSTHSPRAGGSTLSRLYIFFPPPDPSTILLSSRHTLLHDSLTSFESPLILRPPPSLCPFSLPIFLLFRPTPKSSIRAKSRLQQRRYLGLRFFYFFFFLSPYPFSHLSSFPFFLFFFFRSLLPSFLSLHAHSMKLAAQHASCFCFFIVLGGAPVDRLPTSFSSFLSLFLPLPPQHQSSSPSSRRTLVFSEGSRFQVFPFSLSLTFSQDFLFVPPFSLLAFCFPCVSSPRTSSAGFID